MKVFCKTQNFSKAEKNMHAHAQAHEHEFLFFDAKILKIYLDSDPSIQICFFLLRISNISPFFQNKSNFENNVDLKTGK